MKCAIIGMGNMGSKYSVLLNKIKGAELVACTRIKDNIYNEIKNDLPKDIKIYNSDTDLFTAVDKGEVAIDSVIVVTPHIAHESSVVAAFERGISVLCDKPAGVYIRQAERMMEAYKKALEKNPKIQYGFIFHQRRYPVYQKIKEIVDSKKYGNIKRVCWVVTDWYRPNAYYTSSKWRATWKNDGGGTLLNQCPHNLDLLQWMCSMPASVTGFCHEGKYHPIEVEDDVTAYFEWDNGATGTFIASTGEGAGVNRLEISFDDALLVCEKGGVTLVKLDKKEIEYRTGDGDLFVKPKTTVETIACAGNEGAYIEVLQNFTDAVNGENVELVAPGEEAEKSLLLSNAIYLSSWQKRTVDLRSNRAEFNESFESEFAKKCK